ncbi:protein unc-93 homolog A-like [Styela clava]|uniref:protein unc-93 homolog A-like n=1 Tax=Styela clava TaxID=7725 RepID=UPI0019395508|nr:protein unc-93 homolog A-like [Styela clava]
MNDDSSYLTESRRKVTFYSCSVGFSLAIGASFSLSALQSSINVKDGIGTTSLLFKFGASILGSSIALPFVLKRYGPKFALIAGQLCNTLYTLVNFYPEWYTMYPTAFIAGFASCWAWGGSAVIVHNIASSVKTENGDSSSQRYFGMFLVIMSSGQIFSNAVTELILNSDKIEAFISGEDNVDIINSSIVYLSSRHLLTCGSNDCPSEYSFQGKSTKFSVLIPNQTLLRILLCIYVVMQIGGASIHYFLLEDTLYTSENDESSASAPLLKKETSAFTDFFTGLKDTCKHVTSLHGLLTLPVMLLYGLTIAYIWTEYNRAFVSCIVGVQQVGICTVIVDIMSLVTSLVISKSAKKIGLPTLFAVGLIYDLINYTISLLWVPTVSTTFLSYVFSATFGVTHGIRRNTVFLVTSTHSADADIGFSLQALGETLGALLNYAWSIPLCVNEKIYIMMSLTIIATICWAIAKVVLGRNN